MADIYTLPSDISDAELLDEVSDGYTSIDEFEDDFGYQLEPEYEKIKI